MIREKEILDFIESPEKYIAELAKKGIKINKYLQMAHVMAIYFEISPQRVYAQLEELNKRGLIEVPNIRKNKYNQITLKK